MFLVCELFVIAKILKKNQLIVKHNNYYYLALKYYDAHAY